MKTAYKSIITIVLVGLLTLLTSLSVATAQGMPDLVVTAIDAPASASTQQQIEISWTVQNQGDGTAHLVQYGYDWYGWYDCIYLSTDNQLDGSDTRLTLNMHSEPLVPGESYTVNGTIAIPGVPGGNYYLLVVTDDWPLDNNIYESNEANNLLAREITIQPTPTPTPAPTPTPTLSNTLTVASMIGDLVSSTPAGPFVPATTAYLGTEVGRIQPDGGLPEYAHIDGTYWIWMDDFIGDIDNPLYFLKTFSIPEGAIDITGTMQITADNFFNLSINDVDYGGTEPPNTLQFENIYTYSITNLLPGENHLLITASEAISGTPSGLMYKLVIHYAGGQPTPTPTATPEVTPTPTPTPTPNTPAGSNVTVPLPGTVVTFGTVTGEGTTSVNWSADNPGGPTPPNFYVHGLFMNISTTATYTDTVNVCMGYDESGVTNENNLRLFHWNGAIWEDVTTLPVDTVNNIICGQVNALSPFFVGEPAAQVQTATGTGTARFSVSSGAIENLAAVAEGSLPIEGKPSLVFPHGFFSFDISGLSNGETVTVVMELPSNIPTNAQYWKWDSTLGWHQINFSDNDGDRIIAIQLTDNGTGDSDPTPGRIHDDGGPGNPPTPTPTATPTATPGGGGGGGGGCFIATAAYGSSLDSHVDTLRSFRDQYLETNPIGSAFVSLYYKVSPPMAEFINEHPALKPIVRAGLVPAVVMSTVAINTTPMEKIAIASSLAFVCILVFVGLRRKIIRGKF